MNKKIRIFALLSALCLSGCGAKPEVKDVTAEAGTELSTDVTDYAEIPEGIAAEEITLNLEEIDTGVPGSYPASITYKNKTYEFTVNVVDTTAPDARREEDYTICQPGTLTASDYITEIEDATDTEAGFLKTEKREDLHVMTDDELAADALQSEETTAFTEDMSFDETVEITEDGIYDSEIAVKDEAGNMRVFGYTFYVDGTAPVIDGLFDQDMQVESEDGEYNGYIDMKVIDNFDGDITNTDQVIAKTEDNGDYIVMSVTASDRAGNSIDGSANLTWPEEILNEIYNEQMTELENMLREYAKTQQPVQQSQTAQNSASEGLNRSLAEEAFGYVNQKRTENGLPALAWDESIYELACVRAQEIADSFSHTRPDGTNTATGYNLAENIARCPGSERVVDEWMNSEGHRANILKDYYTRSVMACYCHNGYEYWVNLFGL